MAKEKKTIEEKTIWDDARQMLRKAERDGVETAWDRHEQQTPHCPFCESGLSCRNCTMGPCRISKKAPLGVCGADADVIVQRTGPVLGEDTHVVDVGVHAIGQGEVYDPVLASEGNSRLGSFLSQNTQSFSPSPSQYDS